MRTRSDSLISCDPLSLFGKMRTSAKRRTILASHYEITWGHQSGVYIESKLA
jgi:hypothetical protein